MREDGAPGSRHDCIELRIGLDSVAQVRVSVPSHPLDLAYLGLLKRKVRTLRQDLRNASVASMRDRDNLTNALAAFRNMSER